MKITLKKLIGMAEAGKTRAEIIKELGKLKRNIDVLFQDFLEKIEKY